MDAQVTFHKAKDGKADRLTLHQNGNHIARRVVSYVANAENLKEYEGKYYSPELETFYTIKLTDGKLQMTHVHHGETTLKAVSKDRLQVPWWFFQSVEMIRDSNNKILGLRASNGRVRNLWFVRLPDDFGGDFPKK